AELAISLAFFARWSATPRTTRPGAVAVEVTRRISREKARNRPPCYLGGCTIQRFSLAVSALPRLLALMRTLPHSRSCFVCGDSNPIGLKLRLETDGRIVQTQFVPGSELVGFKQTMHGGIVGTLLDEVMAWACAVHAKRFAYCAELPVRV